MIKEGPGPHSLTQVTAALYVRVGQGFGVLSACIANVDYLMSNMNYTIFINNKHQLPCNECNEYSYD